MRASCDARLHLGRWTQRHAILGRPLLMPLAGTQLKHCRRRRGQITVPASHPLHRSAPAICEGLHQAMPGSDAHLCSGRTLEAHLTTANRFASPAMPAMARPLQYRINMWAFYGNTTMHNDAEPLAAGGLLQAAAGADSCSFERSFW